MKKIIIAELLILAGLVNAPNIWTEEPPRSTPKRFSASEKHITFSVAGPVENPFFRQFEEIYREAFRRLGYRFSLEAYPPERSLVEANIGRVDGEGAQTHDVEFEQAYSNLFRVGEAVGESLIVASSADPSLNVNGWASLLGKGYRIGYRRGLKLLEQKLPNYTETQNLKEINTLEQACRMLLDNRLDMVIHIQTALQVHLRKSEFANSPITEVGVLDKVQLYPYLHNKHRRLAPKLADVLRAMKEDGSFQDIMEQNVPKTR